MVSTIIIPLAIVAIAGIAGYLVYRFVLYDYFCKKSVNETLRNITLKKHNFKL